MNEFTAVIKRSDEWWYGWIEEVPGVNAQERSREEFDSPLRFVCFPDERAVGRHALGRRAGTRRVEGYYPSE